MINDVVVLKKTGEMGLVFNYGRSGILLKLSEAVEDSPMLNPGVYSMTVITVDRKDFTKICRL